MNKYLLSLIVCLNVLTSFGQTYETAKLVSSTKGEWFRSTYDQVNVYKTLTFDDISEQRIIERLSVYFDEQSVEYVQFSDHVLTQYDTIFLAKMYERNIYVTEDSSVDIGITTISIKYTIKVIVFGHSCKLMMTFDSYFVTEYTNSSVNKYTIPVQSTYPIDVNITNRSRFNDITGRAFYHAIKLSKKKINEIETHLNKTIIVW